MQSENNVEALEGMYMCIRIYVYIYMYIHMYERYIYIYIYIYLYVCVCDNLDTLIQEALLMQFEDDVEALEGVCIYMYICICTHTYVCV